MSQKITEKVTWVGKIDWELKRFHDNELSTHFRAYGWSGEGIKIINEELKDAGFAAAGWQRYPERMAEGDPCLEKLFPICAAICFRDRREGSRTLNTRLPFSI